MSTRVIGGAARGRRLKAGKGQQIRPTAGRVKEALFDVLCSRYLLPGARMLDLFAGTGGLGIEALSRGAAAVTFIEGSAPAVRLLRENLARCCLDQRARVIRARVLPALRRLCEEGAVFDGAVADPPYDAGCVGRTLQALADTAVVRCGGWVVVERAVTEPVAPAYGGLRLTVERLYGKTAIALFAVGGDGEVS